MTCGIIVPTLGSNIWKLLVFYKKKSYYMGTFENMGPLYKPYDYNFKSINSILNIYKGLKYIILNTLGVDCPPFTQK